MLFSGLLLASCRGSAPATLIVYVYNQSHHPASVGWQRPGLLGTPLFGDSRVDRISSCSYFGTAFDPGRTSLQISSTTAHVSMSLDVSLAGPIVDEWVIRPDGTIAELYRLPQPGPFPSPPLVCGGIPTGSG